MARYPDVPEDELAAGGWELRTRTEETVFTTPAASVVGLTTLYDDDALGSALEAAGTRELLSVDGSGGDQLVTADEDGGFTRFFFATRLSFRPPLAPGIGPASMLGTVVNEARSAFAADLRARGFETVDRGRGQRVRTDSGDRARLAKYTATLPLSDGSGELDVEGWLAVWATSGSFRIAGGAYPTRGLDALLSDLPDAERPPTDASGFRDDLLRLIRGVS